MRLQRCTRAADAFLPDGRKCSTQGHFCKSPTCINLDGVPGFVIEREGSRDAAPSEREFDTFRTICLGYSAFGHAAQDIYPIGCFSDINRAHKIDISTFSNFIEGTTFEVEEAEQIVSQGAIIPNRSEDSHDILGTFQAAATAPWRGRPATTADDFLAWLKNVNALVMQACPGKGPGQWKEKRNMAGNTLFVLPEQVPATLVEGFSRINALTDPVARALMTMFVVSEVHPFQDGNARTARLAMNCVLTDAGLCRIGIPTVYREDYLLPMKRLTNDLEAGPHVRGMTRIYDWTSRFEYNQPRHDVQEQFGRCNAFKEELKNYRRIFPENSASTER